MTKTKTTVVFPMGGEGQRFGSKFKPFLKMFDKTFIQMAIEPFLNHKDKIDRLVFIIREDHYHQFNVEQRFASFGIPIPYSIETIRKTNSPIETIRAWSSKMGSVENVIFCDCDHSVDVSTIFENIICGYDSIIMGYPISVNDIRSWSVASFSSDGIVKSIAEKQYPRSDYGDAVRGVIGCYYFKVFDNENLSANYISDVISEKIAKGESVLMVDCRKAEFFGDPYRMNSLYKEKNARTIFCDIDGTIVRHENIPDYTKPLEVLDGAKNKIEEWRKDNCFIVLTTSRDEQFRTDMESLLRGAGINYETLIMGLPPGSRHLVNDKKPYSNKKMASAYEVTRNIGIKNLDIGNSVASLKFQDDFIVKSLPKEVSDYQKAKFKSQYDSMYSIFKSAYSYCVPKMGEFTGDQYSMENLTGYCGLHLVNNAERFLVLQKVFDTLKELYTLNPISDSWLDNYLKEKIYSKEKAIHDLGLASECDEVFSMLRSIPTSKLNTLKPKLMTTFFVGDLTYENILSNGCDFKLIDFDNDNKPGVVEMDLGKLLQSYLVKYEWWDSCEQIEYSQNEYDLIVRFYADFLNEPLETVSDKGKFYCSLHLFRMIPYQAQRNKARAKKAIDLCKKLIEDLMV